MSNSYFSLIKLSGLYLTCGFAIWTSSLMANDVEDKKTKPNIIYFLVDDLGYADVGFNGCKDFKTPNIDKLATTGAILESFYVQPVCSPSRSCLLSGRYGTHTGVYNVVNENKSPEYPLPLNEQTLPQTLQKAGYYTAIFGKWHLGASMPQYKPTQRGFNYQYGLMSGGIDYFEHLGSKADSHGGPDWYRNDLPITEEGYSTDLIAKEVCKVILESKKGKPLFLYVPFNAVHVAIKATQEKMSLYPDLNEKRKVLAAAMSSVDDAVGKIISAMMSKGLNDNTLIIFSSDNGGQSWDNSKFARNTPLRGGKSDIYEGGIRVCAFANFPTKIPSGIKIAQPIHIVDWYPTLTKLAGSSVKQELPLDGLDIWDVLTKGAVSPHDAILLMGSRNNQQAIRMGDWKLLINASEFKSVKKSQPTELYNLKVDISETNNLADSEPEIVKTMLARLDQFMKGAVRNGNKN